MHFGIQLLHTRSSTLSGFSPKTSYRASWCQTSPFSFAQANSRRGRALALLQEGRRFVLRELTRDEEFHALAHAHMTIRTYTVPLFCSSGSKVCACVHVFEYAYLYAIIAINPRYHFRYRTCCCRESAPQRFHARGNT